MMKLNHKLLNLILRSIAHKKGGNFKESELFYLRANFQNITLTKKKRIKDFIKNEEDKKLLCN